MLLVAIIGPVGSEKTTILKEFAHSVAESGAKVDGFVSVAGIRNRHREGAESYTLQWIKSGESELFTARDDDGQFKIVEKTLQHLQTWSTNLPPRQDLIALDEFGKWEANGGGLMPFWPAIAEAKPRMIVVTLREGVRSEIEQQMGRKFDRVFESDAADTKDQLLAMFAELRDWEMVGAFGASSGGIECTLGAWLHAIRFPFVGTVMGSLQAAVLALASNQIGRKELIVWISTISAGLKAVSPGRARITPVVAITVQGFLFVIGATIGRWTKVGFAAGAFLVGIWAVFQGFVIQYLFFGRALELTFDTAAVFLQKKVGVNSPSMWIFVAVICVLNGLLSVGVTLMAISKHHSGLTKLMAKAGTGERSKSSTRILFWLPLVLVTSLLVLAREQPGVILWMLIRFIGVSLSLYGLAKFIQRQDYSKLLSRFGLWGPAVAMRKAAEKTSLPHE